MNLKDKLGYTKRLTEIISVLFEEGFEDLIYELDLHGIIPLFPRIKNKLKKKAKLNLEKKTVSSIQKLGGLFVKIGQILSTRPELVGPEFAKILEKLQNKNPSFNSKQVKIILKNELKTPDKIFKSIDFQPVSAASFGQVHKAVLWNGDNVAVKIQRPNMLKKVKYDLMVLDFLIKYIQKRKHKLAEFDLRGAFKEIKRYTLRELDYRIEARNLLKLSKYFQKDEFIIFPKPYLDYTTRMVLTMSWESGTGIKKYYNTPIGKKLQKYGTEAMIRQYFDLGTFQGDPHPGNFLVTKDHKLVFIDLGMIGKFDNKTKKNSLKLFVNGLSKEPQKLTEEFLKINTGKKKINKKNLFRKNRGLIEDWNGQSIKEYPISKLFYNLISNAISEGIKLPTDLILFAKSLVTIETLALNLNPKFNLVKGAKPVMQEIIFKKEPLKSILKQELKGCEQKLEKEVINLIRKGEKLLEKELNNL